MEIKKNIRVLIVDDSALIRKILNEILSSDDEIEVVGYEWTHISQGKK